MIRIYDSEAREVKSNPGPCRFRREKRTERGGAFGKNSKDYMLKMHTLDLNFSLVCSATLKPADRCTQLAYLRISISLQICSLWIQHI